MEDLARVYGEIHLYAQSPFLPCVSGDVTSAHRDHSEEMSRIQRILLSFLSQTSEHVTISHGL